MTDEQPVAVPPKTGHPDDDHPPFFLFLRQERREGDVIVDVYYCARCLGRIEVEATGMPVTAESRPPRRVPLPTLGAVR